MGSRGCDPHGLRAKNRRFYLIPIRCDVAIYVCMALDSRFRGKDGIGIGASQHGYEEWSD